MTRASSQPRLWPVVTAVQNQLGLVPADRARALRRIDRPQLGLRGGAVVTRETRAKCWATRATSPTAPIEKLPLFGFWRFQQKPLSLRTELEATKRESRHPSQVD